MITILTIVGARPQFIKAAAVSNEISKRQDIDEIVLHTGQHFDSNMSQIFFEELNIPKPTIQLDINGKSHGAMTGQMMGEIEDTLLNIKPDCVLVYGDTNSTLAGALAAVKLHIPVFHVESGLRSGNMKMPEEINRIITDQVSDTLYCPTREAIKNVEIENIESSRNARVKLVGDVMEDAALMFKCFAAKPDANIPDSDFVLATIHRAENTDDKDKLTEIFNALDRIHVQEMRVVMPLHPRTKNLLKQYNIKTSITFIEPASYLEMLWLLDKCSFVITDSGGLQKEAYFFRKMCLTIRDQTEWVELIEAGVNYLCESDADKIISSFIKLSHMEFLNDKKLYGGGVASKAIIDDLKFRLIELKG